MAREPLSRLDGRTFDVAVIGAGAVGASAAKHLAASGYSVALIDKGDFGAGTSSRSGRLLVCGIKHLEPGKSLTGKPSLWHFAKHPLEFLEALRKAREYALCRADLARTAPSRVETNTWLYPIHRNAKYGPGVVALGFRLLGLLTPRDAPLHFRNLSPTEARAIPMASALRDFESLQAVASFSEYRFEWPERVVVDTVLEAERLGAAVRNYTEATSLRRDGEGWQVTLTDGAGVNEVASITAKAIVNAAGPWIDRVNRLANPSAMRKIRGTKGSHIAVRLPRAYDRTGILTECRNGDPFYIYPSRGFHYLGPSYSVFEDDEDSVAPTEDEIAYLLGEANHLLPSLGLRRSDVLFGWAGVRPQTFHPDAPMGLAWRQVHDMRVDGMPNVFALSAASLSTHRKCGKLLRDAVSRAIEPSGVPKHLPAAPTPPSDLLVHAARHEHAVHLADLLFRRVGLGWTATMGAETAESTARKVAHLMGWDEAKVAREVAAYRAEIDTSFMARP